jgi:microcystin degradation protein MlrC
MIKLPLLLSGEQAVTDIEPARSLYARLAQIEQEPGILDASLMIGCAWTDSPFTTVSVITVAEQDRQLAYSQAAWLADEVWACRHEFDYSVEAASVDEAIHRAMAAAERPVFISDSGDNVTAGAPGDQVLLVERLLALGAQQALVAGLTDPVAVRQCTAAGLGAQVELTLGNQLTQARLDPLPVTAQVEQLSLAPEASGSEPDTALIRIGGVRVILTAARRAFTDRSRIAAAGIDPMTQHIVVVKLGYLFPDLADHAPRAIMALSPGATDLRLTELPYRHTPQPIFPLDPGLLWAAEARPTDQPLRR